MVLLLILTMQIIPNYCKLLNNGDDLFLKFAADFNLSKMLLNNEADVDFKHYDRKTALGIAVESGNPRIVKRNFESRY